MAVTVQTYTATATWTASTLAGIFRSAFIDAGLMTEWFDSFLSGSIENRVLEVQYSGATYGKTYYWFQFTTAGVFVHLAASWNAGSDVPSGTQYLDYFSTTTNATTNHETVLALVNTTDATVTRYSSGVVSGFAVFLIKNGSATRALHIARASAPVQGWIDLSRSFFHFIAAPTTAVSTRAGRVGMQQLGVILRRSYLGGAATRGSTSNGTYAGASTALSSGTIPSACYWYGGCGNGTTVSNNYPSAFTGTIILPINFNNTNTAYATDNVPVFTSLPYSPYINENLPSDFGIAMHYVNNTMAPLDTFTVSAGSEVWDVLAVTNNATVNDGASPLFLARTT